MPRNVHKRRRARPNRRKYPRKRLKGRRRGPVTLRVMRKIIPDRTLIKMRYVSDIVLNPAAGSTASYVYSCNGMYDPDITSTGHQPMGFDQWMAFYQHYTVLGSKLSCSFASSNADLTTGAAIVGVAQRATSTAVSTNSSTPIVTGKQEQ